MNIIKLAALGNGAHENRASDNIAVVPDGWALIPEGFSIPESFPFVGIEAEEKMHEREVEVMEDFPLLDDDGQPALDDYGQPVLESKLIKKIVSFTAMTVTAMSAQPVPDAPIPEPTAEEKRDAQIFYTAMMTDTLLEEV